MLAKSCRRVAERNIHKNSRTNGKSEIHENIMKQPELNIRVSFFPDGLARRSEALQRQPTNLEIDFVLDSSELWTAEATICEFGKPQLSENGSRIADVHITI